MAALDNKCKLFLLHLVKVIFFKKSVTPNPEENLAVLPVGKTWFGPAT